MKQGKYEKAEKKFEAALKKAPNLAEAHNNLGYSLRKQGPQNYERALSHYNRAIELKSDLAEAYMYRGVLHALMGNEGKALEDQQKTEPTRSWSCKCATGSHLPPARNQKALTGWSIHGD